MNENVDLGISWIGTGLTAITAYLQVNDIAKYIVFALGVASGFLSIIYTIYKWYKRASADKKLSKDEVNELIDIIGQANEKIEAAVAKVEPPEEKGE